MDNLTKKKVKIKGECPILTSLKSIVGMSSRNYNREVERIFHPKDFSYRLISKILIQIRRNKPIVECTFLRLEVP